VNRQGVDSSLRSAVADRLGETKFGLWFGDGVELGFDGDGASLEVRVPNAFFREWIEGHYARNLIEAGEAVTGRTLPLVFRVQDEIEPPLGDIVTPKGTETETGPGTRPSTTITVPLPGHPNAPLFPANPAPSPSPSPPDGDRPAPRSRGRAGNRTGSGSGTTTGSGTMPSSRPARKLDDFVPGPNCRMALAAAREMGLTAGEAFSPLVVHGGVGLGKTHLLEGIGQLLRQAHPNLNVLQLTAEAFTNSFLEAMRTASLHSFRARYRSVGALIMDDVHFLAAKRATQDEFLHTFNALVERGVPIVLACDQHPRLMNRLSDELVTRFLGGMVVKVETPDLATRRAILKAKAEARGIDVPNAVLDYIAEHLRSSVRELEGALHSVIAHAMLAGKRLDLNLAKSALRDTIRHTAQAVALRDVERAVCNLFQIEAEVLKSESRARAQAYPRMMAMYLARKHTGAAYSEIGRYFGGRNHSTVISAEKKVRGWLRDEEQSSLLPGFESLADVVADLERTLGA
jgi:chromosomal replication initiator protein